MSSDKQACKVFCGGLSWETSSERLRAYFENYGVVREAFVSYNRNNGRPRGFGFVVFESSDVADKVVSSKHTIDRREVECKKAVPKEEQPAGTGASSNGEGGAGASAGSSGGAGGAGRTRKVFVGGLAPRVDEKLLRQHFEQFGTVEDAVVMYDHDNKRPRGFGFVTFASEESVDKVFGRGVMQTILDKQIEIKPAVPRDQMPPAPAQGPGRMPPYYDSPRGGYGGGPRQQPPGYGPGGMGGYGNMPPPYMGGGGGPGFGGPRGNFKPPGGPPNFGYLPGGGGRGGGPRGGGPQGYGMNPMAPGFPGPRGPAPPGPYPGSGGSKGGGVPAGYEQLYQSAGLQNGGSNGPNGSGGFPNNPASAAALYNLANFQPGLNNPGGQQANGAKLNATLGNHLKALGALASLGAFPRQGTSDSYQDSATGAFSGQETDQYADAAAAGGGLGGVQSEYGFHDAGFTASPAPGWSS